MDRKFDASIGLTDHN